MTERFPQLLDRSDWASHPGHLERPSRGPHTGHRRDGAFYSTEEVGRGPVWHVQSYDEIFIIREGRALFTVGETKIESRTDRLGPANVSHKFHNLGPGGLIR